MRSCHTGPLHSHGAEDSQQNFSWEGRSSLISLILAEAWCLNGRTSKILDKQMHASRKERRETMTAVTAQGNYQLSRKTLMCGSLLMDNQFRERSCLHVMHHVLMLCEPPLVMSGETGSSSMCNHHLSALLLAKGQQMHQRHLLIHQLIAAR